MGREIAKGIITATIFLLSLSLFIFLLYSIRQLFVYVILSAALALMSSPLNSFLSKRLKIPNSLSAAFSILIFGAVSISFVGFFTPMIIEQIKTISKIDNTEIVQYINTWIGSINSDYLNGTDLLEYNFIENLASKENFRNILGNIEEFLENIGSIFIGLFSIIFIAFFFIRDKLFPKALLFITPEKFKSRIIEVIEESSRLLSRYFLGLIIQVFIVFLLYLIILISFGIGWRSAVSIALICGTFNLIPFIGPLIGVFIFISFSSTDFISQGLLFNEEILHKLPWLGLFYILVQVIDNTVNQPLIYGKSVKSHPLEVFLVIMIGGILGGVAGVISAIPFYTMLRVFFKAFLTEFGWFKNIFSESFSSNPKE